MIELITADGKVRSCLGDHREVHLKTALRNGEDDEKVRELLLAAMNGKPRNHSFHKEYQPGRPMTAIGG